MAKRRKAALVPPPAPPGSLVADPVALVKNCKIAIQEALRNRDLGFNSEDSRGQRIYRLSGSGATQAEAGGRHIVVPVLASRVRTYWLATRIEFSFRAEFCWLAGVFLLVFEGESSDDKKSPLLRAEWGCSAEELAGPHAQPHWHVYSASVNTAIVAPTAFDAPQDVRPFVPAPLAAARATPDVGVGWTTPDKFHFAMAARWHMDGAKAHLQEAKADLLPEWLRGCLAYIVGQLKYLERLT